MSTLYHCIKQHEQTTIEVLILNRFTDSQVLAQFPQSLVTVSLALFDRVQSTSSLTCIADRIFTLTESSIESSIIWCDPLVLLLDRLVQLKVLKPSIKFLHLLRRVLSNSAPTSSGYSIKFARFLLTFLTSQRSEWESHKSLWIDIAAQIPEKNVMKKQILSSINKL
jgi:hypothetical protein